MYKKTLIIFALLFWSALIFYFGMQIINSKIYDQGYVQGFKDGAPICADVIRKNERLGLYELSEDWQNQKQLMEYNNWEMGAYVIETGPLPKYHVALSF